MRGDEADIHRRVHELLNATIRALPWRPDSPPAKLRIQAGVVCPERENRERKGERRGGGGVRLCLQSMWEKGTQRKGKHACGKQEGSV